MVHLISERNLSMDASVYKVIKKRVSEAVAWVAEVPLYSTSRWIYGREA